MASFSIRDLQDSIEKSDDPFGKRIADTTKNELDIASQYTFNPERVRLTKDGTRQFVQYGSITGFTDAADVWTIAPGSDENWILESAESVSYVVNYAIQSSFSFELNQSLASGDVLQVGPRTADDGWYIEQRGADHDDTTVDIIELSGGSTSTLASDVELPQPTTEWNRYECVWNWYNVGNQVWTQTYTNNGVQFNEEFAKTSRDGARGPEGGNLNLWYEVTQGAGNSGLELDVGSMGAITLGNPANLTRSKPQPVSVSLPSTNDTWLPIYALRLDPDHPSVNARFRSLDILSYGNNTFLELVVASFDPSKTNASGWGLPAYHHDANSAFQKTTSVSQVPDDTGTQKTLGSSDKFGGYTLASSAIESGGNTLSTQGDVSDATEAKKTILASDELVFLARTGNAGATLRFTWAADQDW